MHGPLPLPSTSLNHKASCISMSPVLPPTVSINSSSRYLMLSCCLPALRHYACGLHIRTERWVAWSRANPCLWRHDSNGRHRDASGEGVFSKIHGCGTNVVEALPWHGYSFPGPGPVGRPPQHPCGRHGGYRNARTCALCLFPAVRTQGIIESSRAYSVRWALIRLVVRIDSIINRACFRVASFERVLKHEVCTMYSAKGQCQCTYCCTNTVDRTRSWCACMTTVDLVACSTIILLLMVLPRSSSPREIQYNILFLPRPLDRAQSVFLASYRR